MIKTQIPIEVDPRRLAERSALIEGYLPLAEFTRLTDFLMGSGSQAWVKFEFGLDAFGKCIIKGQIKADFAVQCQRCLGEMVVKVDTQFIFCLVVKDEGEENLPEGYEALALPLGEVVSLPVLVEDEILLSLPLVPKHEVSLCPVKVKESLAVQNEKQEDEDKPHPFAALAKLKKKD